MKTQGTNNNNAATAKATRDNSNRGEVTTDPAAKTSIEVKTFARAATTLATTAPDDGTMVRAETLISTSRAGVLRREYRFLCAAVTRHETDCQSLSSPLLHSTLIAAGTQQGYVNREHGNQDDRRQQQQQYRRRRPGDDEGRPRVFKPDWMCPRGCGVVFGSKSNCFKCGAPREAGVDEVPADAIYGGVVAGKYDWVCNVLGCRSVNFARRSVCFTCNVPKGPLATRVDQSDRGGGKGGDLLANRFDPLRARQASDAAAAAAWGAAAAAGQRPVDATANAAWAPKEFNETADDAATAGGHDQTAVEPAVDPTAAHQAQQQHAQQPAVAKDPAASKKKRRKEPALPGAIEDAAGGAAAVAALEQSGYVYDPDTGYYKDEASGMWYDANSGLSYHAESAAWYKWNAETNAYEPAAGHAPAAGAAAAAAAAQQQQPQQPQQSAAKKPRVAATIGSTAKLDTVAIKKHQVAKLAAAELETIESAYRDRAAERRSRHGESAAAAATGSVKGKVYGGKIRTPGVPGYAPGSAPPSGSGGAGEGEDSYKASVQRVALERFKAAMKE